MPRKLLPREVLYNLFNWYIHIWCHYLNYFSYINWCVLRKLQVNVRKSTVFRWFWHAERIDEQRTSKNAMRSTVRGFNENGCVIYLDLEGWMGGVKLSLTTREMSIRAARQSAREVLIEIKVKKLMLTRLLTSLSRVVPILVPFSLSFIQVYNHAFSKFGIRDWTLITSCVVTCKSGFQVYYEVHGRKYGMKRCGSLIVNDLSNVHGKSCGIKRWISAVPCQWTILHANMCGTLSVDYWVWIVEVPC